MTRPSSVSTATPPSTWAEATALVPLYSFTPRSRKFSSRAAATSASRWGRTCWRLTSRLTPEPRLEKMCTISTPVTPEPTMTRCSGSSGRW